MDWWIYSVVTFSSFQELSRTAVEKFPRIFLHRKHANSAAILAHPRDCLGVDSNGSSDFLLQHDFLETRSIRKAAQKARQPTANQLQKKIRNDTFHCRRIFCSPSTAIHNSRLHSLQHAPAFRDESNRRIVHTSLVHFSLSHFSRLCIDTSHLRCHK